MEGWEVPFSFNLTGRRAIVTGASRGLGRHFAITLARAGAEVVLAARGIDRLETTVKAIEGFGGCAVAVQVDVADRESVREGIETAENTLGPINILVNNAGIAVTKPILEHTEEDWDSVLDTNLKGDLADGAGGRTTYGSPRTGWEHHQYRVGAWRTWDRPIAGVLRFQGAGLST